MSWVDFYVDALRSGQVQGVGPGDTADAIEIALGDDFVDDRQKRRMRRDFGLVEFHFDRDGSGWSCSGVSIQVHRLAGSGPDTVPAVLRERYGSFDPSVPLTRLAEAVAAGGGGRLVREEQSGEFVRYHVDGTNAFVHTRLGAPTPAGDPEEVWSIDIRRALPG